MTARCKRDPHLSYEANSPTIFPFDVKVAKLQDLVERQGTKPDVPHDQRQRKLTERPEKTWLRY